MSGEQMQHALEEIEPGERLGVLSHTSPIFGVKRDICDFRLGIVPENSELSVDAAYVATDIEQGQGQVIVAVENIQDGEVMLDVDPLTQSAEENPVLLRGVMRQALVESKARRGILNPTSPLAELPAHALEAAGLVETQDGQYQLAA